MAWRRAGAVAVIIGGTILLLTQFLAVVDLNDPCLPTEAACGAAGRQTWWGLSTTSHTWNSGDINPWAFLFLGAVLFSLTWGLVVLLTRSKTGMLRACGASAATLVAAALAINMLRLSQFTSYWVANACSGGACSVTTRVTTHPELGLGSTIVLSLYLVFTIAVTTGLLGAGRTTSRNGSALVPSFSTLSGAEPAIARQ